MTLAKYSRRFRRRPQVEVLEGRTLLAAGVLDATFGGTGLVTTQVSNHAGNPTAGVSTGVAIQPDLKTVVSGSASQYYNGSWHTGLAVARYNTDGTLDTAFGSAGLVYIRADSYANTSLPHAYSIAVQSDGKIVVAGDTLVTYGYVKSKGVTTPIQRDDLLVARLNPDGSMDTTFNGTGEAIVDFPQGNIQARGVAIQAGGGIVVAGCGSTVGAPALNMGVVRLTPGGSLDHTFGPNGQGYNGTTSGTLFSMNLDPSGDILVGGNDTNPATGSTNFAVIRYTPSGLLDPTFGSNGEVFLNGNSGGVSAIGFQSTGQIVVAGDMLNASSNSRTGVARLNANGSLDTTFGSGGYFYDATMLRTGGLAVQPDDKIVVSGENYANAGTQFQIDRILAGGQSLDAAFGVGGQTVTGFPSAMNQRPQAVVIGPDGKLTYTGYAGYSVYQFGVARFLNDITTNTALAAATISPTKAMTAVAPPMASTSASANGPPSLALAPLVLDSPDLSDALHTLSKRRGTH